MGDKPRDPTTFFHLRLVHKRTGKIHPKSGATVMYTLKNTTDRNPSNPVTPDTLVKKLRPVFVVGACSPLDNYCKDKGRRLCMSRFQKEDFEHHIFLNKEIESHMGVEPLLLEALFGHWRSLLDRWIDKGVMPGKKKDREQPTWKDFDLRLSKKHRKEKPSIVKRIFPEPGA